MTIDSYKQLITFRDDGQYEAFYSAAATYLDSFRGQTSEVAKKALEQVEVLFTNFVPTRKVEPENIAIYESSRQELNQRIEKAASHVLIKSESIINFDEEFEAIEKEVQIQTDLWVEDLVFELSFLTRYLKLTKDGDEEKALDYARECISDVGSRYVKIRATLTKKQQASISLELAKVEKEIDALKEEAAKYTYTVDMPALPEVPLNEMEKAMERGDIIEAYELKEKLVQEIRLENRLARLKDEPGNDHEQVLGRQFHILLIEALGKKPVSFLSDFSDFLFKKYRTHEKAGHDQEAKVALHYFDHIVGLHGRLLAAQEKKPVTAADKIVAATQAKILNDLWLRLPSAPFEELK